MFRSIFWLTALVLILPPSSEGGPPPRVSLMESAAAFRVLAHDVTSVCDRHPHACETSRDTLTLLGKKFATGRDLAAAAFAGTDPEQIDTGTLSEADLAVPWTTPGPEAAAQSGDIGPQEASAGRPLPVSTPSPTELPAPRPQLL
ncbi:DUF5330 domain-containing protein [Afifella pfennigii]|uniref:DUF5330 domain-containing protein n=1 Tax=Afifella pfennigii TaxID=209897 RepID=UPI00146FC33E|nr:DUF5330 domain-containing protein [Afifella pfennigii]